MSLKINLSIDQPEEVQNFFIINTTSFLKDFGFDESTREYIEKELSKDKKFISIKKMDKVDFIRFVDTEDSSDTFIEELRKNGHSAYKEIQALNLEHIVVYDLINNKDYTLAVTEGLALSSYAFKKYKTDEENKKENNLSLWVSSPAITQCMLHELRRNCEAVFITRDLVNEPVSTLNVEALTSNIEALGEKHNFKVTVFNKSKLESLKFGGLLGVNKGSIDPPAFHILEWKPDHVRNAQPIVIVGKGIVYDTGGINLKVHPGGLLDMKSDMGGAASVVGTMVAVSSNFLPVHVIGLIPATDNRPGENAIVPGDVLNMHNGKTVEVLNTDAEGRLILADALSYAEKFNPSLVIDLATLTGSAVMALGYHATVGMGTASQDVFEKLIKSGNKVTERIVQFPFWSDYDDMIKSDVADIKNIGPREAGSISAGKFLSHFIKAPWIHLDIAGPAFLNAEDAYRPKGATGVGVRLLYDFIKNNI